jgi:hypothetical protein
VNKTVADKAIAVKADELVRKPFQPQELIGRVKSLLGPKVAAPAPERQVGASSLQSLFAPPAPPLAAIPAPPPQTVPHASQPPAPEMAPPENVWPRALAEAFTPRPAAPSAPVLRAPAANPDILKLKTEIARLELLVKKLQTELQIERQYNQALDQHVHNLTTTE